MKHSKPLALAALVGSGVLLQGCANMPRMTRFSVDGESATSVGIEAEQRFLITRMRAGGNGEQQRVVCAEPSPDVAKAYADAVSASLKVMGKGEVGLSASSAQELATIGVRTAPSSCCAMASTGRVRPT